eukprot:16367-Heterococcus_DN1.PRE.2
MHAACSSSTLLVCNSRIYAETSRTHDAVLLVKLLRHYDTARHSCNTVSCARLASSASEMQLGTGRVILVMRTACMHRYYMAFCSSDLKVAACHHGIALYYTVPRNSRHCCSQCAHCKQQCMRSCYYTLTGSCIQFTLSL